jgi:hypothetical protein
MKFSHALRRARAALAGALLFAVPIGTALASVHELVVADRRAGIALYGFDPVSYFLEGAAQIGSDAHELIFDGFAWHFRSEANRAAFRAEPDVYVPRFGGYDPVALTRGAPVAGNPAIFAVYESRLYLFQKPESRDEFLANPAVTAEGARANWARVRRSLVH